MVSQKDLMDLTEAVATELQRIYTTTDINSYLRRFGIQEATKQSVPSKRVYVKTLLAEVSDDAVRAIASDLGILKASGGVPSGEKSLAVSKEPYAFISYQHDDRLLAGRIKSLLARVDVRSFMAHEDIDVSEEWRARLLQEMSLVTMFIAILTSRYFTSTWCVQESGIAAFRTDLAVVPLSFDGTVPQGFLSHFQAKKVDPTDVSLRDLLPGFLRQNLARGLDVAIRIVGKSVNYRDAEANFDALRPHIQKLDDAQIKQLLDYSVANDQVLHASRCAKEYLPPIIEAHGHLVDAETLKTLRQTCQRYGASFV